MSYCEKEILTHVSPVDHEKLMMILSCRRCGVLQVWEHGIGESRPNWMNAQAETLWAQHVMNTPQLVEETKAPPYHQTIPLDFHGTNTAECEWEIRRPAENVYIGRDRTIYRLRCKRHGNLCDDEIHSYRTHYQVVANFNRVWEQHLKAVEEDELAIWTPPATHHSPAVSLDQCERLLVERTDPQSSQHFLLLLCKRHGQIGELPLTPSNSWSQQKEMDKIWANHLAAPEENPKPKRPKAPAAPKDGPGFGKIGKRKFA